MGRVFRAFDRSSQRLVALKLSSDEAPSGPAHPLSAEFETWSRLRHPNIVRAYELGVAASGPIPAGIPYLVLEHVHGRPAHQVLGPGTVDAGVTETALRQLLTALDHVHRSGYVHRDLKPTNVLLGPRRNVKLTDFGLAVRAGTCNAAGTISGSLPYVSPEALLGLPLDARADLYSLGILLYQLVTGELPFPALTPREILGWHLQGPPADEARAGGSLSPRLARFIRRLTARDRAARPASALEALTLLGASGRSSNRRTCPVVGRAARAELRLALDAVRLGGARIYRLPASRERAAALVAELSVWAQVRGMRVDRLDAGRDERLGLARIVAERLVERGSDGLAIARRFGLPGGLPLEFLGRLPLVGCSRGRDERRRVDPALAGRARGIAGFLAECATRRPAVILVERGAPEDPLVREVVRRLVLLTGGRGAPGAVQGGLLLAIGAGPRRATSPGGRSGGLRISEAGRRRPDASTAPPS